MAGYSGTPLPRKLGIRSGHAIAFRSAPDDFEQVLGELPADIVVKARATAPLDVLVAFFARRAELERHFERLAATVYPDGGLWIVWPKRASRVTTDLTEDLAREIGTAHGLVDNKVCAIDETWSGLRLVYRLRDRPGGRRG